MDAHLDSRQIDSLLRVAWDTGDGPGEAQTQDEHARQHLATCEICQSTFRAEKKAMERLAELKSNGRAGRGSQCPPSEVWLEVVAGINQDAENSLSHASQCDHCGPLLREASEDLSGEITPEQEQFLTALDGARPERPYRAIVDKRSHGFADQDQGGRRTVGWHVLSTPMRLVFTGAAFALFLFAGWLVLKPFLQPSAGQLLAQAYTDHRTLEARIPGAKFAPMRVERGATGSDLDKPASLLRAEVLIAQKLAKDPNDPGALDDKARADLVNGDYDSAIGSLQRALERKPNSPELLTDLGTAYFSRAKSADTAGDLGKAYESLSKALLESPGNAVALFNRALTGEQSHLYTQAQDDWEHYLRVDPQGDWAEEAQRHLDAVKRKLAVRGERLAEPLLSPQEILGWGADRSSLDDSLDQRIEEYLKVATVKWLPDAFASATVDQARAARHALGVLARIAQARHDDYWLGDLLNRTERPSFTMAIKALAASLKANERGDYSQGCSNAHIAARLFRDATNSAGELRAQAEEVYADHLLWEGERCGALIHDMSSPLEQSRYTWIRAQMNLEASNCADQVNDMNTYHAAVAAGTQEAEAHHYRGLFLRGLGFQSLAVTSLGESNLGLSLGSEGLALFWSGYADLMKGYNLYTDMDAAADAINLPYFQVAISREATALIDRHPDVLLRAMAHRWYGNAAYLASLPELASSEFATASRLFSISPKTAATVRDRVDAEVWLAKLEIRRGDVKAAETRLDAAEPVLDTVPGFNPHIGFYTARAEIAMRQGQYATAEASERYSISLAESALSTFSNASERRQWAEQAGDAYRSAVEWKLRMGDPESALELWEWYRGAEFRSGPMAAQRSVSLDATIPLGRQLAPPVPRPTVVADQLPQLIDESIVTYGTFQDGIVIWVYDDRGVSSKWVPASLPQVRQLVTQFHRLCSNPASDLPTLRATARSLYDLLIAPISDRLSPGRALLLNPDDSLAELPWEALLDHQGRYLGQFTSLSVTPGIYQRAHLRGETPITAGAAALVVSVPAPPGMLPLANAQSEAEAVAGKFASARLLQSGDATLSAIRRELPGKLVFHFTGHAVASPERSGLVLAEIDPQNQQTRLMNGESLQPEELEHLQLAVLSTCSLEDEYGNESPATLGLVQTLLRIGVPHVVASRWKVDSQETEEFMRRFYQRLLSGDGVASSMQSAQMTLASRRSTAHPYYWAGFELQGLK